MNNPKIIVDESVSAAQFAAFARFARRRRLDLSDCVFIKETHPGIPDSLILQHYLDDTTILVTTDRPFHNTVLERGRRSYYVGPTKITDRPLPGIRPQREVTPAKDDLILKDSYEAAPVDIRPLLLPAAPGQLKKLRVKRRRIRNYFQGIDHMEQVAVTVSRREQGRKTLIGIRLRIASKVGLKALDASESYLLETVAPDQRDLAALCHALVLLLQLMLQPVKVVLYYDADRLAAPPAITPDAVDRYQAFFKTLLEQFEHLEFVPVTQGPYLEKLRGKLSQLARSHTTNEIVPGNLVEIIDQVLPR